MLLFVYSRSREIFGNAEKTSISIRLEKTNTDVCIRNNLFRSIRKRIDSFFVKPVQITEGEQYEIVQ